MSPGSVKRFPKTSRPSRRSSESFSIRRSYSRGLWPAFGKEKRNVNGGTFIAQCLQQEGVSKVFGQCGHTNYALIDACHKIGIEYISFRHEQMAAHAADGYYRSSHKLAVLNVHLSPGMTNAITGVATAAAD